MKIRNGFVSNSSTSSFVLVGVKANKENQKKLEEKYPKQKDELDEDDGDGDFCYHERLDEEYDIHYLNDEYGTDKIGVLLGYGEDSSFELSQKEVNEAFDKVKGVFGENCEPKLFSGVVAS
jgi:hypothetical protein